MAENRSIEQLAGFLVNANRTAIPDRVFERAADCVLDVVGAAAAGRTGPGVQPMQAALSASMSDGPGRIWFADKNMTPAGAAAINAMAATALDIDDGHRMAAGHPGAAIVSAAIAVAEEADASLDEFLIAVVLGYEAAVRVALARRNEHYTSTVSGRWSGIGAAVAAARLRGYSPGQMQQTILLAEQQAPRLSSAMLHGFAGSNVKEGIAWSVLTGIVSADLAAAGFIGYPDTFEQNILYDPEKLVEDLNGFTAIDGLFFKPYACCRWIHAALDALQQIQREQALDVADIQSIEVATFRRAVELGNHVAPDTEMEAQFSIPFCVGAIVAEGAAALTPLDHALLSNARVRSIAELTHVVFSEEMESAFPARAPAIVRVTHAGGVFERRVDAPFGDPTNPMDRRDLQSKFRRLTHGLLENDHAAAIIDLLDGASHAGLTRVRQAFCVF